MSLRLPASLKLTLPLVLLGMVALLGVINALYNLPRADQAAETQGRHALAQEMSRLQSTVEYLLLRGDPAAAQHQVSVLAHNLDYRVAALTDAPSSTTATSSMILALKSTPGLKRAPGVQTVRTAAPSRMARTKGSSQAWPTRPCSTRARPMAAPMTTMDRPTPGAIRRRNAIGAVG